MKRFGLAMMLVLLAAGPMFAAEQQEGDKKFTVSGEVRSRWEWMDNLLDFDDSPGADDGFDIWPYRVRVGVEGKFAENVTGFVEVQNFGLFGDEPPFKSSQNPGDQFAESANLEDTNLYQGFLQLDDIGGSHIGARFGRQEHTLGYELQIGDNDFYNGVSFDGLRGMWDSKRFDLGAFFYRINDVTCTIVGGPCGADDATFAGITANIRIGDNGMVLEPYVMNFQNQSDTSTVFLDRTNFLTYGGRFSRPVTSLEDVNNGRRFDWNAEVALQDGDIGPFGAESNHSAWLSEGWFGFNWKCGERGYSRVHVGTLISSGDKEDAGGLPDDGDHEDYLFLFTDFHANNRLGDADLEQQFFSYGDATFGTFFSSGVTNYNVGYEFFGQRHSFLAAFHQFMLTEENCVNTISGGCQDDLGQEVDLRYGYRYSDQLGFEVGLANFMPGDAISDSIFYGSDDDGMRVWGQARLRF